jgi:hypothetical protein
MDRRKVFEAPYKELAESGDQNAKQYLGGNVLSRDAVEYLGADATDEQIQQGVEDMNLIHNRNAEGEDRQAAKQRIAGKFPAYYQRVMDLVRNTGINTEAPCGSNEEVLYRAGKLYPVFRFVQIGNNLNQHLAGLVPPEQRAFISAVYSYIMAVFTTANTLFSNEDETVKASYMENMTNGKLTLGYNIDAEMTATLARDEKAMRQGGQ